MKLIALILIGLSTVNAQDTLPVKRLQVGGYVKDIQSLSFQDNFKNLITGNLIHNRINLKWKSVERFSGATEIRNRLYWGEEVKYTPDFSSRMRNPNEYLDLSWNVIDEEAIVFNTTIDRLWIQYDKEKWNLRAGRQRVNWGIGTTWNPNDLFNTFNFLNWDYEEKPGADAIKFQYYTGMMNNFELAVSFADSNKDMIAALKYFMNVSNYDLQFIGGLFHEQPTLGFGWSGSIMDVGFKGEVQSYFFPDKRDKQINICIEADQIFKNGLYLNGGVFYNSQGMMKSGSLAAISSLEFSPQRLMPTKWNTILTISKEVNPLFTANCTVIFAPGTNLLMVLPTLTYSLKENLDVNLVWQSFFAEEQGGFDDMAHLIFLRLKWSF